MNRQEQQPPTEAPTVAGGRQRLTVDEQRAYHTATRGARLFLYWLTHVHHRSVGVTYRSDAGARRHGSRATTDLEEAFGAWVLNRRGGRDDEDGET